MGLGLVRDSGFRGAFMVVPWVLLLGVVMGSATGLVQLAFVGEGLQGRWIMAAGAAVALGAAFRVGLPRALGYWVLWVVCFIAGAFLVLAGADLGNNYGS